MKTKPWSIGILLSMALVAGSVQYSHAAAGLLADLENALMCKCDDKCGKVLINCTCSTSDKTRAKFTKMLESGLTVEQIIQQQVDQYGETVLSAPTKNGFNLTAWMTPFAAIVVGGIGVRRFIRNWTQKSQRAPDSSEPAESDSSESSGKYSRRLQDELDNLEL